MNDTDKALAFRQLEQPGVLKRLYDYAYAYNAFIGNRLPPEWTPQDVVHEAIKRLVAGPREWDPVNYPEIVPVVRGVIRSLYSHLPERDENKLRVVPHDDQGKPVDVDELPGGTKAHQSTELEFLWVRTQIEAAIEGEDDLVAVYLAIIDGCVKPSEIADDLGITVEEVNNRLRRLRRRCRGNVRIEVK